MIKSLLSFLLFFCLASPLFSQTHIGTYDWEVNTDFASLLAKYKSSTEKATRILDVRKMHMQYSDAAQQQLQERFFYHQQVYLNHPDAVDWFNKIYMPLAEGASLLKYNARVITPDGEVKILSKEDIKEDVNDAGNKVYFYALSGISVGSIVEYFYVLDRSPRLTGIILTLQNSIAKDSVHVEIRSPINLEFAAASLNGLAEPVYSIDSSGAQPFNVLTVSQSHIPPLPDEKFSNADGSAMTLVYKLFGNTATGKQNLFGYADFTQSIFNTINQPASKSALKSLKQILAKSKYKSFDQLSDQIQAIEHYVKSTYTHIEDNAFERSTLESTFATNQLNELGATRLFWHLFKMADINCEIVLSCSRDKAQFQENFECYAFLDNYLIYFPEIDNYLTPGSTYWRLGLIPSGNLGNKGLFMSKISLGELETAVGEVKPIQAFPKDHTVHDMDIVVNFKDGVSAVETTVKQSFTGYYATSYQPYYDALTEKQIEEVNKNIIEFYYPNEEATNIVVQNSGAAYLMQKPFEVSCRLTTSTFIEEAGNNIIFKVGDLIGPQAEMYQEKERILPIENSYNRSFTRTISFNIPDGYTCKNLDILNFNVNPFPDKSSVFLSSYKLEGNQVTVTIEEYYDKLILPTSEYKMYQQVVNAAADFNKLALVFDKQ